MPKNGSSGSIPHPLSVHNPVDMVYEPLAFVGFLQPVLSYWKISA